MSHEADAPSLDPSLLLAALISDANLAFYARDAEGRYTAVSHGYCDMLGVAIEQCLGRKADDFLPPALAARVDLINRTVIESGQPLESDESYVIHGKRRHFLVHRVPIMAKDGRIAGVFGIAHEQTQRVRLLKETEAMNRVLALFTSTADIQSYARGLVDILADVTGFRAIGMQTLDAGSGRESPRDAGACSSSFIAQQGLPGALVETDSAPEFLKSDCPCAAAIRKDAKAVAPALLDEHGCLLLTDLQSLRARMGPPHPLTRWIAQGFGTLAILPLRHQEEALGCLVLGDPEPNLLDPEAQDFLHRIIPVVSEAVHRFAVERRLEGSSMRLQAVVHGLPLPVWIVDSRFRVVFRNEAHVRHFGPTLEGVACHQALSGSKEPCPDCDFPETLMRMTTRREWHDPRTDRAYDVIAVPYDAISGERQRLEVFFEVTERVRMQAQLRQTQRLDSLGSLAAGIAHDFNNILAGIIGYSQLGLQRCEPESDGAHVFDQIGQIAERGAELTRKILAFSRRQALKVAALDINALILGMRTMLVPLAGDRVEVVLDLADGLWAVQGDGSQIEQVLLNLCVNAVEAMPGGGRLTIRTCNVEGEFLRKALASAPHHSPTPFPHPEPTHGVLIEVSDTGHGMPPEVVSQAVEPFFTTKGRGRGTGLGLSVSYGIVQQHHGNMIIESAVGCGTTVRVCLPSMSVTPSRVCRPAPTPVSPKRPPLANRGLALIVEDDPPIRGLVATMLRELGIEASTAAGGAEALEVLSRADNGIRLVITDVAMPGMSGTELARRVRQLHPEIPILFMSGCSDSTLEQYGLSEDHVLLRKPFTLEDLLNGIDKTLSQSG